MRLGLVFQLPIMIIDSTENVLVGVNYRMRKVFGSIEKKN